jgi:hypothetical protein
MSNELDISGYHRGIRYTGREYEVKCVALRCLREHLAAEASGKCDLDSNLNEVT